MTRLLSLFFAAGAVVALLVAANDELAIRGHERWPEAAAIVKNATVRVDHPFPRHPHGSRVGVRLDPHDSTNAVLADPEDLPLKHHPKQDLILAGIGAVLAAALWAAGLR